MPYYSYQCNACGALKGDVRSIEHRHDGPTCHVCHAPNMRLVIDPVRGIIWAPAVPRRAASGEPLGRQKEPHSSNQRDELERAKIHGPDIRTIDALKSAIGRAEAAEADFIQVHKNCVTARELCDRLRAALEKINDKGHWPDREVTEFRILARELGEIARKALAEQPVETSGEHS